MAARVHAVPTCHHWCQHDATIGLFPTVAFDNRRFRGQIRALFEPGTRWPQHR
jgi:hypothetical protein